MQKMRNNAHRDDGADIADRISLNDSMEWFQREQLLDLSCDAHHKIKRAEAVEAFYRLDGEPDLEPMENFQNNFNDVDEFDSFSNAIKWASHHHYVYGVKVGDLLCFQGERLLTWRAMVEISYRFVGRPFLEESQGKMTEINSTPQQVIKSIRWASQCNLINGGYEFFLNKPVMLADFASYLHLMRLSNFI
jgi:hypothetical protein